MNLLTLQEVEKKVKRKKSSIYADKTFPKPIKVGGNNRWLESEIDQYIANKVAERDGKGE